MLNLSDRPGKFVRYCADEVDDLCAYISLDDFIIPPWSLDGDAFSSMTFSINPLGIVASIDSHPGGYLFDENGVNQSSVSWNGSAYVPTGEIDVSDGFFFIRIEAVSVTLTDGSACTYNLISYFNGEGPTVELPEFSLKTTKQTDFTVNLTAAAGTIDWGDGNQTTHGAVTDTNYAHTYSAAGTYDVLFYCAGGTTIFEATNEGLTLLNLSGATAMKSLEVQTNSGLTSLTPPTLNTQTWVKFIAYSCNLTGTLNLSALTNLGARFEVYSNPLLTGLIFPVTTKTFTFLLAYSCNLTGTINLSNLTGLAGNVQFNNNSLLTAILWPASTGTLTRLHLSSTGWIGHCDLSTVTITTDFEMRSCTALTQLTFKSTEIPGGGWTMNNFLTYSSSNLTGILDVSMFNIGGTFQIYSCDITGLITNSGNTAALTNTRLDGNLFSGSVDLSDWDIRGYFNCSSNTALTDIVHSANGGSISQYYCNACNATYYDLTMLTFSSSATIELQNNAMTATEVNHFLVDLDSILGAGTGIIRIAGTNAAPDLSSGGFDGITAKNNLIAAGWSVTTN
jgi:hypothetical protein